MAGDFRLSTIRKMSTIRDIRTEVERLLLNKSILITGATGFIGRNVLNRLVQTESYVTGNLEIYVVCRNPSPENYKEFSHENMHLVKWDINESLEASIHEIDYVMHLASENNFIDSPNKSSRTVQTSVQGTQNVIETSIVLNASRFLMASSGAVYPRARYQNLPIAESQYDASVNYESENPYTFGKRQAEKICLSAELTNNLDVVIARLFTFVGPYLVLDGHYAIGNFLRDCMSGRQVTISGSSGTVRSYQYSEDTATWLLTILLTGVSGSAYNIGSDHAVTIHELALTVAEICGNEHGVVLSPQLSADSKPSFYVPNIELAKNQLHLTNTVPLEIAIARTFEYLHQSREMNI